MSSKEPGMKPRATACRARQKPRLGPSSPHVRSLARLLRPNAPSLLQLPDLQEQVFLGCADPAPCNWHANAPSTENCFVERSRVETMADGIFRLIGEVTSLKIVSNARAQTLSARREQAPQPAPCGTSSVRRLASRCPSPKKKHEKFLAIGICNDSHLMVPSCRREC